MEYKLEDTLAGLQQIKDQKYAHSYHNSSKEVILMGIAFDRTKKEVKKIEWEVWDKQLAVFFKKKLSSYYINPTTFLNQNHS